MLDIFFERYKKNTPTSNLKQTSTSGKKANLKKSGSSSFKENMISQFKVEGFSAEIDSFIEELNDLQSKIMEKPSIILLEQYRAKIGNFLKQILDNHQAIPFYKGIKNRIELKVWATVNNELDEMANMVISGNVQGFALLSKFNMIKGIIVDLKVGK